MVSVIGTWRSTTGAQERTEKYSTFDMIARLAHSRPFIKQLLRTVSIDTQPAVSVPSVSSRVEWIERGIEFRRISPAGTHLTRYWITELGMSFTKVREAEMVLFWDSLWVSDGPG